ncbi:hypothetical protein J6590_030690 [Homalodisca vitripennis]|nr:hypothetical protein J6590_030690 [Homalodisca vitripennis]
MFCERYAKICVTKKGIPTVTSLAESSDVVGQGACRGFPHALDLSVFPPKPNQLTSNKIIAAAARQLSNTSLSRHYHFCYSSFILFPSTSLTQTIKMVRLVLDRN